MTPAAASRRSPLPWLFSYHTHQGAAWTSWIVGAIAVIAGVWAVPGSLAMHRHQPAG